jgi:hypothetical protein
VNRQIDRRRAALVPRCRDRGAAGRAQVSRLCASADPYPDGRGAKYRRACGLAQLAITGSVLSVALANYALVRMIKSPSFRVLAPFTGVRR